MPEKAKPAQPAGPVPEAEDDLRASFREALARKQAKNANRESHMDGHSVGTGNNDTHKRQFRRKSG